MLDGLAGQLGKPERDLYVHTTLDLKLQAAAEKALAATLARSGARNAVDQGAVIVLDTAGAVRAMVGGRDHRTSPFNRAASAHRQPGSAFKPFVYLTALEAGWQPGNTIDDRPVRIGKWQPVNFDGKFRGQDHAHRGVRALGQQPGRAARRDRRARSGSPTRRASSASPRACSRCPRSRSAPRR